MTNTIAIITIVNIIVIITSKRGSGVLSGKLWRADFLNFPDSRQCTVVCELIILFIIIVTIITIIVIVVIIIVSSNKLDNDDRNSP